MSPHGNIDDHTAYFQTASFEYEENSTQMEKYDVRHSSFFCSNITARVSDATARAMSQCGMYHTGFDDVTRCHSCHKVHNNWKKGDRIDDPGLHETGCHYFNMYQSNHHCSDLGAEPFWYEDRGTQWSIQPSQTQSNIPAQGYCALGSMADMIGTTLRGVGSSALKCLDQCLLFGRSEDTFLPAPPVGDVIQRTNSGGNASGLVHKVIKTE